MTTTTISKGQLESAAFEIRSFAERATEVYDVCVFALGVGAQYGLFGSHNLVGGVGSHVMLQPADENDFRQITVDIIDGEAIVRCQFDDSLVG